jgi:hypothetical protein
MTTHNKSIEEEVEDIVDRIISGASSDGGLGWRDDTIYDSDEASEVILALLKRERKEMLEKVKKIIPKKTELNILLRTFIGTGEAEGYNKAIEKMNKSLSKLEEGV